MVRAGIYAPTPAALADDALTVLGPGGTRRAAFVTHDDIATVITAVPLDEQPTSEHNGATLEVTAPRQ